MRRGKGLTLKPYAGLQLRIPYTYRTPNISTGTKGVSCTGKKLILGAEMVPSTGINLKMKYGYRYGKKKRGEIMV